MPLDSPTSAYEPSEDYRRRSTPPPAQSKNPPAHAISDSDESDTETRPRWPYSPPRKAPRHADDAFLGHRQRSVEEYPEPPHGPYGSKQTSAYPPEPEPSTSRDQSYAWPPTPRDFDNDRSESVASNEDEPDFSFSAVVDMIRNFHDIERPTAPVHTATAFDQMRGLQSDRAPAFHLPMSPLLGGLIDNANSALAWLIEEQSNGFVPFPMKRHRRFYRTASTSLSAPYVVPPSLAPLTREKPGDHKLRPVSLPYTVLTGLESALAGIGETISWLDWWLSTVSGFSEALHLSVQANFERILSSGSKAIAFVGSQAVQHWPICSSPAAIHSWWRSDTQCQQKNCLSCDTSLYHLLRRSSCPHSWTPRSTRLAQRPTMLLSTRPCIPPASRNDQPKAVAGQTPQTGRMTHREGLR